MHPLNIAHRGGAGLRPENTVVAFADAIARGCDGGELDAQLSADGVAVVHHDFRLNPGYARKDGVWLKSPAPRIIPNMQEGSPDPYGINLKVIMINDICINETIVYD